MNRFQGYSVSSNEVHTATDARPLDLKVCQGVPTCGLAHGLSPMRSTHCCWRFASGGRLIGSGVQSSLSGSGIDSGYSSLLCGVM